MPWLKRIPHDKTHVCRLPDKNSAGVGSTWQCEKCGNVYKIAQKFIGDSRKWKLIATSGTPVNRTYGSSAPLEYLPPPPRGPSPSGMKPYGPPSVPAPYRD